MVCFYKTGSFHIRIKYTAAKISGIRRLLPSRHPNVAKSKKGKMGTNPFFFAIGCIYEAGAGLPVIIPIKIALLQNFAKIQSDFCSLFPLCQKAYKAGKVLSEIQHRFTGRRYNNFLYRNRLFNKNGKRSAVNKPILLQQALFPFLQHLDGLKGIIPPFPEQTIQILPVINPRFSDAGAFIAPASVGFYHLTAAVPIFQVDFGNHGHPASVDSVFPLQTKGSHVPALSQKHLQPVLPFLYPRQRKGKALKALLIMIQIGSKELLSDFFTVQKGFKQAQPADVEPGPGNLFRHGESLFQKRMKGVLLLRPDPFPLPDFSHLAGFKGKHRTQNRFTLFPLHNNPVIVDSSCLRHKLQLHASRMESQAFNFIEKLGKIRIKTYLDPGIAGMRLIFPFQRIGTNQVRQVVSHRISNTIYLCINDFHRPPFLR